MNSNFPRDDSPGSAATFNLPFLFRIMSIVALAIAWPLTMATSSPQVVMNSITAIGMALGLIVGYRRHGSVRVRVGAAIRFFGGSLVVALYSAIVAATWQAPVEPMHPFEELGAILHGTVLVLALPAVLAILLFLLRAWTWSAHDRRIYQATKKVTPSLSPLA